MVGSNHRMRISLRFNSFEEALEAHLALTNYAQTASNGAKIRINSHFFDPAPLYYDGMFSTRFEGCIKDKFRGLDVINEVRSDYVKHSLVTNGIEPTAKFASLLNPSLKMRQKDI